MYHVEVLAGSTSHAAPGWAYVPDRAFGATNAPIAPAVSRKRGIREPGRRADISGRQHVAIARHLAELDRENHRDVQIPIPAKRHKEGPGRVSRGKSTSNVRRILQSQKTFKNYLDDEEAALAQLSQHQTAAAQRPVPSKVPKPVPPRRSSTPASPAAAAAAVSKSDPARHRRRDTSATAAAPLTHSRAEDENEIAEAADQLIRTEYDDHPLLRSYIPSAPSERIMQMLLKEPPLSYNAARAGPPTTGKSPRQFCCICGYWGKIRCRNCYLRTCGLDCYKMHEDSRCGAFF